MNRPGGVFKRILVPTDFSAQSEKAWAVARGLAQAVDAELLLVHVCSEAPLYSEGAAARDQVREVFASARAWAERTLGEWADRARGEGLRVHTAVHIGAAHREIVEAARAAGADLVVVGTHGRGGLDRALIGSVADRVIRTAPCPVLAVREPELAD
jgi:nucleotide-binding universal stress UspA family protein